MSTVAEVRLWGSRIAAVSMPEEGGAASFQYDPEFVGSGIQVAPLTMPLRSDPYAFPHLHAEAFHGLPGLLADSLPDRYGHALIDAWLAGQGRSPESFNAVERLCYIGKRGMGALEFAPARGPQPSKGHDLEIEALVELASEALAHRERLAASLAEGQRQQAMRDILSVGTSAGGARAKAVIAFNPLTQAVRSGQLDLDPGFEHWLLKFDGIANNRDKDALADPDGYGAIEYAYSLMARDAGIAMTECRLLQEGGRRHFMTRRFDRGPDGAKRHMQSLGALAHLDFNQPGAHSYEQAFDAMRSLGVPHTDIEQLFLRMAFNIVARNQDDHVKNIAFLMDRAGRWSLAPAFDVTYAYRPSSPWVGRHQMSMNGKRDRFTLADFDACGRVAALPRGRARRIVRHVTEIVSRWGEYAERVGVDDRQRQGVGRALRLRLADEPPRRRPGWRGSGRVLLAALVLAVVMAAVGCGGSMHAPSTSVHASKELAIPRHAGGSGRVSTADAVASLCRKATARLGDSGETEAPAAMRALAGELRQLHVPRAWKPRVDRYVSALRKELPLESTMAAVAKTGEQYPIGRLIGDREAELSAAARRLGVGECAAGPL